MPNRHNIPPVGDVLTHMGEESELWMAYLPEESIKTVEMNGVQISSNYCVGFGLSESKAIEGLIKQLGIPL